MKMDELIKVFEEAAHQEFPNTFVMVEIEMEGYKDTEYIINSYKNFAKKLAYYQATYDENCEHKFAKGIRIISAYPYDYHSDLGSWEIRRKK